MRALVNNEWVKVHTVLGKLAFDNTDDEWVHEAHAGDYPADVYVVQTDNGLQLTDELRDN